MFVCPSYTAKFFEAPCIGIKRYSNATSKKIWIHCACAGVHIMEFTMICDPPQNRVNFPYEIWKPDSWGQKLMTKGQSIFHAFSSKTSSKHKQPCKVKGVIIFLQKETWRAVKKQYMLMQQLDIIHNTEIGKLKYIVFITITCIILKEDGIVSRYLV